LASRSHLLVQPGETGTRAHVGELGITRPVAEQRAQRGGCFCAALQASENTVTRVSNTPVRPTITRATRKDRSRKVAVMTAMNNHGAVWGERIRRLAHEMFKEEKDVTIVDLHQQMRTSYPEFALSTMSLWRLMKGLGFSYKILKGQRYIFERSDLARKRSLYLRKIEELGEEGLRGVHGRDGMVKKRGWMDNTLSRFPSEETIQQYSCGKTAGKNKGKRGIVIMALCEGGIIPGCTRVLVCGPRTAQYSEMDHTIFEEWLRSSIPLMREVRSWSECHSSTRQCTLPYEGTREGKDKFCTHYSGLCKCSDQELHEAGTSWTTSPHMASKGGSFVHRDEVSYRPVTLSLAGPLRYQSRRSLSPTHWSCAGVISSTILTSWEEPTDRLETVRIRAVEILRNVPRSLCEGWCWEAMKEEDSARLKEALDANNNNVGNEEMFSSLDISSDSSLSDESLDGFSVEL
ncbi:hypothetical protein OSTOST_07974, partial [Ostertagia ostertagi]